MKNTCINCDIKQCKHNAQSENFCTLEAIRVGTHEANPTMPECTDCKSFVAKTGCC